MYVSSAGSTSAVKHLLLRSAKLGLRNDDGDCALHLAVTVPHTKAGVADRFVRDLGEVTGAIMADPASADNSPAAVL